MQHYWRTRDFFSVTSSPKNETTKSVPMSFDEDGFPRREPIGVIQTGDGLSPDIRHCEWSRQGCPGVWHLARRAGWRAGISREARDSRGWQGFAPAAVWRAQKRLGHNWYMKTKRVGWSR